MKRSVFAIPFVLLFGALSISSAAQQPRNTEFRESPVSPVKVGGSPIAIEKGDVLNGDGLDDLGVIDSEGRLLVYENLHGQRLEEVGSIDVGDSAAGLAMVDAGSGPGEFATVNPDADTLTYVRDPYERPDKLRIAGRVTVGDQPSNVAPMADIGSYGWSSESPTLAVSNSGDDTVSLISLNGRQKPFVYATVPVGSGPSDLASVSSRVLLVANEQSNDVTLVKGEYSAESGSWEFRATQTLPAGASPVAVHSAIGATPGHKGIAFVVVNRGSDSVTTYGWNEDQLEVLETVPVGDRPTAVSSFSTGRNGVWGYAVTNGGSNDVSLLAANRGVLDEVGRFKTGRSPSAITPLIFNEFFSQDLAVTSSGSGSISIHLRHETSATCLGHPAFLMRLTSKNDYGHKSSTGNPDRVLAGGGNDQIEGGSGGDCVYGQTGNDLVGGGRDADLVSGGTGNDRLSGRGDSDIIKGGPGNDRICEKNWGTNYSCWARIAPYQLRVQKNRIDGGPGRDLIDTDGGRDRIDGGPGRDRILANEGKEEPRFQSPDRIDCGSGRDVAIVDRLDETRNCEKVTVK